MRTTNIAIINSEFKIRKNWKEFYQWKRIVSKENTEIISDLILKNFTKLKWANTGLRSSIFKTNHLGYCQLQNGKIDPFTEKRFCRAVYNEYNKTPHSLLGLFLDYETPLTAPKQKAGKKINQGEIDLLSYRKNELLFIEAKVASSNESLLKAILEIFVYVMRLQVFFRLPQFLEDYGYNKSKDIKITPCVLTFPKATSGEQLLNIKKYPNLIKLIDKINAELKKNGISELEFYIVDDLDQESSSLLKAELVTGKNYKVTFKKGIKIKQHFLPK